MTSFSVWMGIGTASGILKDQGLNIIINIFYSLTVNAARGICMQVMSVFSSFASNIGLAISPQITKSYSQGDIKRSISLTFASAKAQGYLVLVMMIPFLLESHYILTIWLKSFPVYTHGVCMLGNTDNALYMRLQVLLAHLFGDGTYSEFTAGRQSP